MNEKELYDRINLLSEEALTLKKEIDTLNENVARKDNVLLGLYSIIVDTKDVTLVKQAEEVMLNANFDMK
jgi:hypothetical protein